MKHRISALFLGTALAVAASGALAQDKTVKIGVLNDRSGLYADITGEGSAIAARMAIEDFKAAEKGIKAEVVVADHQNKPDIAATIARQWYDGDGVDLIDRCADLVRGAGRVQITVGKRRRPS